MVDLKSCMYTELPLQLDSEELKPVAVSPSIHLTSQVPVDVWVWMVYDGNLGNMSQ